MGLGSGASASATSVWRAAHSWPRDNRFRRSRIDSSAATLPANGPVLVDGVPPLSQISVLELLGVALFHRARAAQEFLQLLLLTSSSACSAQSRQRARIEQKIECCFQRLVHIAN